MDSSVTYLLVVLIVGVVAYVAQRILVQSVWQKKGVKLSTGRLWPALSFFGMLFLLLLVAVKGLWQDLTSESSWMIALVAISIVAVVSLFIRNIKKAGWQFGIAISLLQTLSGLLILLFGVVKLSAGMAGVEFASKQPYLAEQKKQRTLDKKQEEKEIKAKQERQEAYAQHDGYASAQDAFDAGDTKGIDPDLLK